MEIICFPFFQLIATYDDTCGVNFVDALWGGGKVIQYGGNLNINTFLANGDNTHSVLEDFCTPGPGPEMANASDFVIHLILRAIIDLK